MKVIWIIGEWRVCIRILQSLSLDRYLFLLQQLKLPLIRATAKMATQNKLDLAVVDAELKAFVERLPSTKSSSKLIFIVDKAITRGKTALNDWSGQLLTLEGIFLLEALIERKPE